jgi:diguanylate cyclase
VSNHANFRDDLARNISQRTMAMMAQHGIAATPLNYEIWYNYAAQSSPHLNSTIDRWIDSGSAFTSTFASELHEKFLSQAPSTAAFSEIGERMGIELERLAQSLEQAGRDNSSYGHALRGAAGILGSNNFDAIRSVVDGLILATRHVEQRNRALEARLNESTSEVQHLREDIETVRQQSLTDPLTGLANRKAFDEALPEAIKAALAENASLCLLMGDIDFFKTFNDNWGHQTGDQVLRLVARCLTENTKGRDKAVRYGGEEFAVILPCTTVADAAKLADAIRRSVQSKKVVKRSTGETLGTITMSFGVAMLRQDDTGSSFIERTDLALYAAKHAGRNCVRTDVDGDVVALPVSNRTISAA